MLVYAYDAIARPKQGLNQEILSKRSRARIGSFVQVLAEFAAILLHKLMPPVRPADVILILDGMAAMKSLAPMENLVRAVEAYENAEFTSTMEANLEQTQIADEAY